jgi:hypothetical protein
MIETLITLLLVALIFLLVYYCVSLFMGGRPLQIVGIILGLLFLLYALRALKVITVLGVLFGLVGCASIISTASDSHPNRDHVPVLPGSEAKMMTGTYTDVDLDGWLNLPRGAGAFKRNSGVIVRMARPSAISTRVPMDGCSGI